MKKLIKFTNTKTSNGITLVALVITIIILLILAGITLASLSGENGILRRAGEAAEETKKAQYKEIIETIIMEEQIERTQNPAEERAFIEIVAEAIREKDWVESAETCDDEENYDVDPKKKTKIIVETKDGYEIIVNIDNEQVEGEVVSVIKGKAEKWTVEFNANGGSGTVPTKIEKRKGWNLELPTGEGLSRTGYKIVGWSENPDENPKEGKVYKPGESYTLTKDITILYAIWDTHTIQVTFDINTGTSGEMASINIPGGTAISLPENRFSKTGYVFQLWNTSPDGKGTSYGNKAQVKLSQDTTLYAIWKENITATLNISNNQFVEETQITLGGTATSGIQKVELIVGNNILYTENVEGGTNYNRENLKLDDLNKTALLNLDFYDITVRLCVTSMTGNVENTQVNIKNYTIGSLKAFQRLAQLVNDKTDTFEGKTIILLNDISSNYYDWTPVGYATNYYDRIGSYFSGTFDR